MRFREGVARGAALAAALLAAGVAGAGCGKKSADSGDAATKDAVPIAESGSYLHVVVPSVIAKDEKIPVRLRVVTYLGIPDYDFEGALRLDASSAATSFPEDPAFEPRQEGYYELTGLSFGETGVQRLRGSVPQDTVQALANPFVVQENPEWRIYWGDLNSHSDLSSGARAPAIQFWYARNVALLDFAALTDSDRDEVSGKALDEKAYLEANAIVAEHDQPGRFVSIPALEWTSVEHGYRIVLLSEPTSPLPTHAAGIDTPEKLAAAIPAGSLLLVPHPSGAKGAAALPPASWTEGRESLVEIYSSEGIFEAAGSTRPSTQETPGAFVHDLLAKGARPGFVATSDSKLTTPGNPRGPGGGDSRWPIGLTAILAKELTRASVLDALRARRTYATTGHRYLLEFTVDGQPMGSDLPVAKGHRAKIYASVGATTNWLKLEVVGPDGVIATLTPEAEPRDVIEMEAETAPVNAPTWVYARGTNETGGMVWSSPVYLRPE